MRWMAEFTNLPDAATADGRYVHSCVGGRATGPDLCRSDGQLVDEIRGETAVFRTSVLRVPGLRHDRVGLA